ncbi:MAG: outer membrane protein assembly factor BamB [Pseudomonadota bacterium]
MAMRRLLSLTLLALLVSGCASTPEADPPAKLEPLSNGAPVRTLWSSSFGAKMEGQLQRFAPLFENGKLYVADTQGWIASIDAASGKTLWTVETKAKISTGLAAGGALLLAGTRDAEVLALRKENGAPAWRGAVSSEVLAPPAGADGAVVVRTVDDKIFALDAKTGNRLWSYSQAVPVLTLRGTGAPVIAGDKVLVGLANGTLVALGLADGKVLWEIKVSTPQGRSELEQMVDVDANPLAADGVVYAVSFQGRLVAVSLDAGRLLWARDMSSFNDMVSDQERIYVTDSDSQIWALDRASGAALWKQDKLRARAVTAPVIQGDYVVVGDMEGYLHWLARDDGHFVARHKMKDSAIASAPVVADGVLYVRGKGGALEALQMETEKK